MANKFKSFSEFFDYIAERKALDIPLNKKNNYIALYNMTFNQWLQETKGWEFGDEATYLSNLTKANWIEFKISESESLKKMLNEIKEVNESWNIENIKWQIDHAKVYESEEFKTYVELFNNGGGSYKSNNINAWIYSPSIAYIIGNTLIPCVNSINETVNGLIFDDAYLEGFKEGTQYFESNYNVNANTVYLIKDEGFVADLKSKYKQWSIEADIYPYILSKKVFKNIGYYSGLVFAAKELAKKYPSIFVEKPILANNTVNSTIHRQNQLETTELERCLHLIGYWLNNDETVIDKLLDENIGIVKEYSELFSKELNYNLICKDTFESKKDLIKYYIFEFWELQAFYKKHNEILFTGILSNYTSKKYEFKNRNGIKRKLNKFENNVVNSQILFDILINDVQLCCVKYKIDFFSICEELSFSTDYFDSGTTLAFEEMKNDTSAPQQTKQETPIKFISNEYALAYIFDLYSNGKQIPFNRTEGGYNKKEIIQNGFELYQIDKNKDTFYRAVKQVANNDLNKQKDLANISLRWIEAVKTLSKDWNKTKKYLQEKKLIGE